MTSNLKQWSVTTERIIHYDLISCDNLFDPQNDLLLSVGKRKDTRRMVIVDDNVYRLYSLKINSYFSQNQVPVKIIPFVSGEANKNITCYESILRALDSFEIERRSEPIIAIGGGVLTDVVSFVASTYRRGIPYIKVPTTLMGYVDASIGIKTGINFNGNKNRVGSFYPPSKVFLDKDFLKTLPKRHILNGVAEIIKLAVIKDSNLFELLENFAEASIEKKFQDQMGVHILNLSIEGMINELQPNLFEDNLMRSVDFGHTFFYKLEMEKGVDILHGEAVVLDVILSSVLAFKRGLLFMHDLSRIFTLILNFDFPVFPQYMTADFLWQAVIERAQHRDGQQRIPLPQAIGKCVFVNDIQRDELESAALFLTTWIKEAKNVTA